MPQDDASLETVLFIAGEISKCVANLTKTPTG
jgi:hypothetical protein